MTSPRPPRLLDSAARAARIRTAAVIGVLLAGGALVDPNRPLPVDLCLFKHLTGMPCPTCGLTRAVCHALQGDLMTSLSFHPAGIIALSIVLAWGIVAAVEAGLGRRVFDDAIRPVTRGAAWTAATVTAVAWVAQLA